MDDEERARRRDLRRRRSWDIRAMGFGLALLLLGLLALVFPLTEEKTDFENHSCGQAPSYYCQFPRTYWVETHPLAPLGMLLALVGFITAIAGIGSLAIFDRK